MFMSKVSMINFFKKNDIIVITGSLIATIGRGITLPFFPLYLHDNLHIDILNTGSILTLAMCIGMLLSIPVGKLSDHYNHKLLLIISLIIFSLSFLLMANFASVIFFIICFSSINCSYAVYSTIIKCFISNNYKDNDKTKIFALNYTFVNIGWIIGPLMGTWIFGLSMSAMFYFSFLAGSAALFLAMRLNFKTNRFNPSKINKLTNVKIKLNKFLFIFTVGTILSSFVFGRFASCLSQILMTEYSPSTTQRIISLLMATNAATVVLFQYITGVYISKRKSIFGFATGTLFLILGLFIFNLSKNNTLLWIIGMILFSFGEIIFIPLQYRLIDTIAPLNNKAQYFSIQNFGEIGGALSPLITGLILTFYTGTVVYLTLTFVSIIALIVFTSGVKLFHSRN